MHLEETIQKIEGKLKIAKGLNNVKIHIENLEDKGNNKPYIEFKAQDKNVERKAFKLYSK